MATLTVPSRVESVRPATAFLVQAARELNVPKAAEPVFEVAISEAVTNAVRHGSRRRGDAVITCDIQLTNNDRDGRELRLRIIDGGEGFDVPPPRPLAIQSDEIESVPERGYGLPIIQSVFPIVRVIQVDGRFGLELGLTY
jgi:anti-sigma regulatory factor (Ser/Thr protein kinase)